MERFRTFLKGAFSYPRLLLKTHPVTAISIITTTVLFAVYTLIDVSRDYDTTKGWETPLDIFMHICLAILFFAVFSLCLESIRPRWSTLVKSCVMAFFGILSFLMSFIVSDFIDKGHSRGKDWLVRLRDSLGIDTVALYIGGLMALALLLALYFSYSHDIHQRFNDHVMNAGAKMFFTSIIYGVIQLGVLFLTIIISILLYDDAFEYLPPVLILINGLFFAPALICAAIRENEKANVFMQVLVRYVMLTIVLLAYAIIYIYILKLVITRNVPSNSVYAILTALFIVSMIVTYTCTVFEDKGFLQKFAFRAPIIFAPFILMQCYTVFVRIGQYGLTPARYFGIAFILFEITYIVYYMISLKKSGTVVGRNLLLVICIFIVLAIFAPGLSGRSMSVFLARRTMRSYLDKVSSSAAISDREYVWANAAYGFLNDNDWGEGHFVKYFGGMDEDTLQNLREGAKAGSKKLAENDRTQNKDSYSNNPKDGWFNMDLLELAGGHIDIGDYDELRFVNIVSPESYNYEDAKVIDTSALEMKAYNEHYEINASSKTLMTIDLTDYCTKFNELTAEADDSVITYDESRSSIAKISVIDINENARFYITNADISRNADGKTVRVDISGYLFTKD